MRGPAPRGNPTGDVGRAKHDEPPPWDDPVRLADVKARFEARTAARLKDSSRWRYWKDFERFAEGANLERCTRRQLAGRKGAELLIRHYGTLPLFSRHVSMSRLKKVWRRGLGLEWPLDVDDLPRPPAGRIVPGPRDADVEPWAHAAANERDVYLRAWFAVELSYGLRPVNQQANLRRRYVAFSDATGKPLGFVAHGAEAGMKTDSYLVAAFPDAVADAVASWLKAHPDASPDAWLFPWRNAAGDVDARRPQTDKTIRDMRSAFARRWGLQWLTSKGIRKFVKATLNRSGMPDPVKSYWQGHRPKRSDMDFVYGTKPWDEVFAEQLHHLPNGPLGLFGLVTAKADVPPQLADLWRKFRAKEIDALDFVNALKALERQPTASLMKP